MNRNLMFPALWIFVAVFFAGSYSPCSAVSSTVTLESLLEEMVNRETIARLPSPAYTCRQASSYERNSTEPGSPTWWANADRSYFVRVDEHNGRREHVLMDVEGPGAVVRFWATWHGPGGGEFSNGTLRVYLDGKAEPVIEGPMAEIISGGKLIGEPLSYSVSPATPYRHRGHNLYLPIPYARSCRITYETDVLMDLGAHRGEALYYQINYRTYEADTRIESFSLDRLERAAPVVERVKKMLAENQRTGLDGLKPNRLSGRIQPSQQRSVTIKGQRAVRLLEFQLQAEDLPQALRSTILRIVFDGKETVWAPIGDLFGTGYHMRPHATWYSGVTEQKLSCYWVMPFRESAEVTILNLGSQPIELSSGRILTGPWQWDDRSCHFHAAWKQWTNIETQSNAHARDHGAFDLNWVTVHGQGTYVGDVLTLFNTAGTWWGEGDEKIYVDGESFPSHFGTGTEDYYGYAWCRPEYFHAPFHAQPSGEGNLVPGFTVNLRYRALDAIPFDESIQVDMELWHWARTKMNYAPTTIWYARPGARWNVRPDADEARLPVPRSVEDIIKPRRVENAIEGETLSIRERTGGVTEVQNIPHFNWSNNRQLWWRDAKPNDRLVIEFDVKKAGKYEVTLGTTKAPDYGIVRLAINGQSGIDWDGYHTSVMATDVKLPTARLRQGTNTLEVMIVGANPAAVKRHMFGLDYILARLVAE